MVKDSLFKLNWLHIDCSSLTSPGRNTELKKPFSFYGFPRLKRSVIQSKLKDPIEKKVT